MHMGTAANLRDVAVSDATLIVDVDELAEEVGSWIRSAVLPPGSELTEVTVDVDGHTVRATWRTTAWRPDSRDRTRLFECPWGGEVTVTVPTTGDQARRRVWTALFEACLRDVAHELGEHLRVGGLCADPHADDVSVVMGDLPAWEECVNVDSDLLADTLF